MKTKLQILSIALTGLFLSSCSSSMNMSKTSVTPSDDIYYSPSSATSSLAPSENSTTLNARNQEPTKPNLAQLEKKYSEIISSDTANIDTLIYKAESSNPYDRVLSDSYQESYERRLKGMYAPHNRMDDYGIYYSQDYWYASTFDPEFYKIVVVGDQVWVEPWYISSMFLWPHNHFNFGFNFGGWNLWAMNPGYPYYNPYGYNNYYGYNNWYGWDPYYYNSNYYTGNYNNYNSNYNYYGRRTGGSTSNTTASIRTGNSYENQIISDRRRNGTTSETVNRRDGSNSTTIRTRNTDQNINVTRNQEVVRRNNRIGDMNTTRLRGEGVSRNNGTNLTEPTRRTNNSTYQRPRSTNNDNYIRPSTRNQNDNSGNSREVNTRTTPTTREGRVSTPTYNSPNRVGTSTTRERSTSTSSSGTNTTTRERSNNSGSTPRESSYTRPSSNSNSSSGSSSSSSSGSSSNGSSGGSSSTRRR